MTYELAIAYLASLDESRIKPGLERIEGALRALGAPHLEFPHVLVGGTNGKGSVVSFMGSVLSEAGYRTGLFTSPHLKKFEERIVTDGMMLSQAQLPDLVEAVKAIGVELTYFEFATAMAMVHFAREGVELALLEVGIGGAWDATNASDPALSVITTVDSDHLEWLGPGIEDIAREKAGIMRSGRPVIVGHLDKASVDAVLVHARSLGAQVILAGREYSFKKDVSGHSLHFQGAKWNIKDLVPGLDGAFQLDNAACALAALEALASAGFEIDREDAIRGIESAAWPGRFQVMDDSPYVIVDAAHNPAAVRALTASLTLREGIVWLFSALSDKDVMGMAEEMARASNRFVLVPMDHPRALTVDEIEGKMPDKANITKSYSISLGMSAARRQAGDTGLVVVAGSVVLAGEVLKELGIQNPESRILNVENGSPD